MNVVGFDVSTRAVDAVKLPLEDDRATWERWTCVGQRAEDRLGDLRGRLPGAASAWWDDVCIVALERPQGRQKDTVAKLMGVVGFVVAHIPVRLAPWWFMPAEWRRECGLPGNAPKEVVANFARRHPGMPFTWPQDAYDAYCVAYAARAVNRRANKAAA